MIVSEILKKVFPRQVITAEGDIRSLQGAPNHLETCQVAKSCLKRKQEFIAGRNCAKKILAEVGINGFSLLGDENGMPLWPEGIAGSISHSHNYCGAVCAWKKFSQSIGLDIQWQTKIKEEIWPDIFTKQEISSGEFLNLNNLIFSAKECFFKFQYPLTMRWLDFKDVEISVESAGNIFLVRPAIKIDNFPSTEKIVGHYVFFHNYVITGIY